MKRRQFLQALGLMTISGKFLYDTLSNEYQKNIINKIYSLAPHVHKSITTSKISIGINEETIKKQEGYGIVLDNKYLTMAHIVDASNITVNSPFGFLNIKRKVIDREVKLYGKKLEELVYDEKNDIAILGIPNNSIPNFPCKLNKEINYGDEIYIIGNPHLTGTNIRKGTICDLDGLDNNLETKNCFGIDARVFPGDSGTPIVNKDFELLGLVSVQFLNFGYIKKIEEYLEC